MHKSKINKISLAVCLAFMPIYGFTAGLGKLSVDSGLGEPLRAQIDLLSVTPEELSTLTAAVASEEAYALQGIPRLGVHGSIRVELAKNPDGSPMLKLRSQQPIDDPYLDMLIQVDWASGRLLREYTILLDPPGYKDMIEVESAPVVNKPMVEVLGSAPVKSDAKASSPSKISTDKSIVAQKPSAAESKTSVQAESSADVAETKELTTQRGDTLNSIARELQVEGVSLDQMLVGVYEANKKAFVDGNMNRLKVGQIIKVPSKETLTALSAKQATKEVKVHTDNWNAYRNSLAGNVIAAPVAEEVELSQSASGKISTAEDKAAAAKAGVQDVVKLSAGGKLAEKSDNQAAAQADAKILALQEEATAREKALKEAQERAAALETQIADMQKFLALKSQTMADMQKNAADTVKPAANEQVPVQATTAEAQPLSAAPAQDAQNVENKTEVTTSVSEAVKPAATQQPVSQPVAQPVTQEEEPSFFDAILDSINLLALGGAGGVALLGAGWMYLRNKRRRDLDSFERGILTSGGLRANTVFGNTTGNETSSADTSFLTDFAQSADGTMIDTHDVDPIAEAEVYMAYGRDAQAEEILKDAIAKEPKRYELHLKLLEMYAARKDASAFETIAGELYTTLGSDDPTWAKVAQLGATVEPDNPLYDVSQISAAAVAPKLADNKVDDEVDFLLGDESAASAMTSQSITDAAETSQQVEQEQPESAEQSLDFSTESFNLDSTPEAPATEQNKTDSQVAADNSMDFDFPDIGNFAAADQDELNAGKVVAESEPVSSQNASELSFPDIAESGQEMDLKAAATTEEAEALTALDFSFPDTPAEEVAVVAAEEPAEFNFEDQVGAEVPVEGVQSESSALDSLNFQFEQADNVPAEEPEALPEVKALKGISLDLTAEQPDAADVEAPKAEEEVSFDFSLTEPQEIPSQPSAADSGAAANEFDFSSINLDLGETDSQNTAEALPAVADETVTADIVEVAPDDVSENPDVDIKLDLVKVYIDMEDEEGARDLLQEVLKEGGPKQRAVADRLLATLA